MSKQDYSDELYFGESLQSVFTRGSAIQNLIHFFNSYHWGPPDYEMCGDVNVPADKPVIRGRFLPAECMEAASLGFRCVSKTTNVVQLNEHRPK